MKNCLKEIKKNRQIINLFLSNDNINNLFINTSNNLVPKKIRKKL